MTYLKGVSGLILHNAKFDLMFLMSHGYISNASDYRIFCTMVSSQVVYNGWAREEFSLKACLLRELKVNIDKQEKESFIGLGPDQQLTTAQIRYAATDVFYLHNLKNIIEKKGSNLKLSAVLDLEMRFLPVLATMELEGSRVDVEKWKALAQKTKALRLVMQLLQVVQGPPRFGAGAGRPEGERPRRGYQGSAEARGFARKPRFDEDDGQ